MKIVFLVFFVSSFLCFTLLAKDIFIKASAKIYNNDIFEAKERVLKNAKLKAVKKGVEIFLVKKTINDNYQAIKEQIYDLNQNFIKNFEIVYQDIDLDQPYIEVQIKANVAEAKIKQKLKNLGILHDRMGYKSLMLLYQRKTLSSIQSDHEIVQNIFPAVLEAFAEHGFLTFDKQTMRKIYQLTELKKLDSLPVD